MADSNEIGALRASLRGAAQSAGRLNDLAARLEGLDPHTDVADADLEELHGVSLANAIAAQALRGFVESMRRRRGIAEVAPSGESGLEE